ncbi:MAG: ATPase [Sphingobacteriaceae bacterium]|jgi:uncharacterized protein YndB with AHSA1/START domain|nr:ATPase [Sphingobacteriaceae bacterium]
MEETKTSKSSVEIKADVEQVWDALVNPEKIKHYLFGTQTSSDWKVGSPITFKGEWEGKSYEDKGTILEIERPRLLKYSYWSSMSGKEDKPENYVNVTYRVQENDGSCILTISQGGIKSETELEHMDQNWSHVLQSIKELVEQ